jgi:AraC-like DNA-binding protein
MNRNQLLESNAWPNTGAGLQPSMDEGRFVGILQDNRMDSMRKVERSIAYMVENIDKPLRVATLATLVNVSPSHFFALFKQGTGVPPMGYFIRLRMCQACELLGRTSARVKEVAAAVGYDDQFYFSRVFKSVYKVPPSLYRESGKRGGGDCVMSPGRDRVVRIKFSSAVEHHA